MTTIHRWLRSLGLDRASLTLGQRLLYFWVRPRLLPIHPAIRRNTPLLYVLESHSLFSLLVLIGECHRAGLPSPLAPLGTEQLLLSHAVRALQRRQSWWQSNDNRFTRFLPDLLDNLAASPDQEVQLVPVSIFWGRNPEREQGSLRALFQDIGPLTGRFRKLLTVLFHGRDTWVEFSEPVSLQRFAMDNPDREVAARKLVRVLRVHFYQQRTTVLGPTLQHRHTLINTLLETRGIREAIDKAATETDLDQGQLRASARRYAEEIVAGFSYPLVLLMRRTLHWLWTRLYDGIQVQGMDELQRAIPGHQVIYVPCHRSHMDYLLLLYLLYSHGMAMPRVAAGANMNAPVMGFFVRRGGAFFLRRRFKGNHLYAAVLREYLYLLLAQGFPIKYFIEGGRSRTGLSLPPKMGMLDMTLRGFLRYPYRPVVFIPIYIGYERLVEGGTYLKELRGGDKRPESLWGLLQTLRHLRSRYGTVHVNVGEPIRLPDFLEAHYPDWQEAQGECQDRPDWLPPVTEALGQTIMTRINAAAAVNPLNLIALTLIHSPGNALLADELTARIGLYQRLLARLPLGDRVTVSNQPATEIVSYAATLTDIRRQDSPAGPIVALTENSADLLGYCRNNCLHLFALPATVAYLIITAPRDDAALEQGVARLFPYLHSALFLPWHQDQIAELCRQTTALLAEQGLINRRADHWQVAPDAAQALRLDALAALIQAPLRRTALLLAVVDRCPGHFGGDGLDELIAQIETTATALYGAPALGIDAPGVESLLAGLHQEGELARNSQGCYYCDHPEPTLSTSLLSPALQLSMVQILAYRSQTT